MSMITNSETPQRRAPRCGSCGGEGHNRRTCPSIDTRLARRREALNEERRDAMDRSRWEREAARIHHEQRIRRERHQREREAREERARIEREEREEERIIRDRSRYRELQQQQIRREQQQEQAHRQRTPQNRELIEQLMRDAEADQRIMQRTWQRMTRGLPHPAHAEPRAEPQAEEEDRFVVDMKHIAELPVIRDTVIEMKECPICMDTLGETGKIILKCGHSVCQGCFLQQMMRAVALKKTTECACPMCRVNYIE